MKVAIYTRVSTQMQAEKGVSLDAQKSELIEYCNKNNIKYRTLRDGDVILGDTSKKVEKEEGR